MKAIKQVLHAYLDELAGKNVLVYFLFQREGFCHMIILQTPVSFRQKKKKEISLDTI